MSLMNLLMKRRSIRKYTKDKIDEAIIKKILQAGMLVPSSRAIYPLEYIVVRDPEILCQLANAKNSGSEMLQSADTAIVVIGNTEKSDAWIEDASISMTNRMLEATELGIGNCWVQCRGRVSREKIKTNGVETKNSSNTNLDTDSYLRKLLGYPKNYSAEAMLSLGIPAVKPSPHTLSDLKKEKIHQEHY